jgi:hypothetical protein
LFRSQKPRFVFVHVSADNFSSGRHITQKVRQFKAVNNIMPAKTTNSLRDKLDENQLDLSLMQLTEVPVNEIVSRKNKTLLLRIFKCPEK